MMFPLDRSEVVGPGPTLAWRRAPAALQKLVGNTDMPLPIYPYQHQPPNYGWIMQSLLRTSTMTDITRACKQHHKGMIAWLERQAPQHFMSHRGEDIQEVIRMRNSGTPNDFELIHQAMWSIAKPRGAAMTANTPYSDNKADLAAASSSQDPALGSGQSTTSASESVAEVPGDAERYSTLLPGQLVPLQSQPRVPRQQNQTTDKQDNKTTGGTTTKTASFLTETEEEGKGHETHSTEAPNLPESTNAAPTEAREGGTTAETGTAEEQAQSDEQKQNQPPPQPPTEPPALGGEEGETKKETQGQTLPEKEEQDEEGENQEKKDGVNEELKEDTAPND